MDTSFVKDIEDPDRLQLQQQQESAREAVRERLRDYDMVDVPDYVLHKLTYTYYHDWKTDDPRFMFLLEDPGIPGEHVIMEVAAYVDLDPGYDPYDAIQIDRRFGARWLAKRGYTDFTSDFLEACADNGLIEMEDPWWQYLLSGGFFDDFYMADVIKYRGVNASAGDINTSFYSFLSEELEYLEPDLIFAFGKRAWTTLMEKFDVDPLGDGPVSDSILDVHGHVYRASGIVETDILPLGHMSGNCRGSQISKSEYQQGIDDGLEKWRPG